MSAIDPGTEEAITDVANDIEAEPSQQEVEQEDKDDIRQPSRWWFASVACPLVAGTFGPIASGFNVCALSVYWREVYPSDNHAAGHLIPDPNWLLAINALSLLAALAANVALLLNMAHRINFAIGQSITIIGFALAGALLAAILATLTSSSHYFITNPEYQPADMHGLSGAFFHAIFAAMIYLSISGLMGITVMGALRGHYPKDFQLTSSQRTLMLQTMSFITYLLLGALVFNVIEDWGFENAVYWSIVTLLTIGLGDFSPKTSLGRGLLFPFAIGGILVVGLVIGSIRSLILERGKQKMSARITEKRRRTAVQSIDDHQHKVKVSMFASADLSMAPMESTAQRREAEFLVMRKVQEVAASERKYYALLTSATFALFLWFAGAAVFELFEFADQWTYLNALYFSFTSLMTIGYGDFSPKSNGGRAFFVFWALLAVPSLTILISNMGDTIVKWVSDLTNWVGGLTVLPAKASYTESIMDTVHSIASKLQKTLPAFSKQSTKASERKPLDPAEYDKRTSERICRRLGAYVDKEELDDDSASQRQEDSLERDIEFYHYVLARECRNVQKHLNASYPTQFEWWQWEYFLKLMGDEADPEDFPSQFQPDVLVPEVMKVPAGLFPTGPSDDGSKSSDSLQDEHVHPKTNPQDAPKERHQSAVTSMDGNVDRQTSVSRNLEARRKLGREKKSRTGTSDSGYPQDWSWLSDESPLMSGKSEAAWILDRLSAALERELHRQRKGYKTKPPISFSEAREARMCNVQQGQKHKSHGGQPQNGGPQG